MPRRIARLCLALAVYFALAFGHAVAQTPTPQPEERVAVEVRFLAITPRLVDKYLKDGSPLTFDAAKLRELLGDVQGDVRASVLHYLKVTMDDGRRCVLREDHHEESDEGVELSVLPTVSADRRSVRVALKAEMLPVTHSFEAMRPKDGQSIAVNETFAVPDGRTVVFGAGARTMTVREREKIPVLGDVPYLGWLFTKATETEREERILILVTPRIVPQKPN